VKTTTTIAGILEDAEAIGYYRADVMRHLRWLYTWGDFIEINGVRYFPKEPELDPVAPHERRKAKRS
jgi:hypothetical protein